MPHPYVFPWVGSSPDASAGAELRDLFAAVAMHGLLGLSLDPAPNPATAERLANASYRLADAMIERREKS